MRSLALVVLIVAALASGDAPAQTSSKRIRGDVVALDGTTLKVKERSGEELTIKLDDNYTVAAVVKTELGAIKPGSYVGTATLPQADGSQRALEVLLFPEAQRGAGEGHYPWDLKPGSMMTNATVADVVKVDQARRMTLRYKDGEKVIVVPENVPIVTFEPGDKSMLKPGAHVILTATAQPDGALKAARVSVGKDGLVPPM